ncbi:hypothetical protein D3C78_1738150 [compost metagenome]
MDSINAVARVFIADLRCLVSLGFEPLASLPGVRLLCPDEMHSVLKQPWDKPLLPENIFPKSVLIDLDSTSWHHRWRYFRLMTR